MWFSDIEMQFLSQIVPMFVIRDLAVVNYQAVKKLFSLARSSPDASRLGKINHVEQYNPHLQHCQEK